VPARIGRYQILERVGVGGMAEAYRALARGPGGYQRQLIIKCIQPQLADDPEFVRLFVAEAKILGMLNHPNIVQVYDFGEQDGRPFLAMEYLDGPSVAQLSRLFCRARMPMPVGVAVYLAHEMCLGLAAAHGLCDPTASRSTSSIATSHPPTCSPPPRAR
jgi:serine/threonine-protein kinase